MLLRKGKEVRWQWGGEDNKNMHGRGGGREKEGENNEEARSRIKGGTTCFCWTSEPWWTQRKIKHLGMEVVGMLCTVGRNHCILSSLIMLHFNFN